MSTLSVPHATVTCGMTGIMTTNQCSGGSVRRRGCVNILALISEWHPSDDLYETGTKQRGHGNRGSALYVAGLHCMATWPAKLDDLTDSLTSVHIRLFNFGSGPCPQHCGAQQLQHMDPPSQTQQSR